MCSRYFHHTWNGLHAHQADRYGLDPILIVAAYNAGGVYGDDSNPWNLRTYGLGRIPKFAAYVNDWLSLEP